MPSYMQYKRQLAVLDADNSEIESWITVKGNHIPIMKGQSKEEAVKSFIEKKGGKENAGSGEGSAQHGSSKYEPEFESVRKNALANSSLYGGRYTQKSKAEAYREYKKDNMLNSFSKHYDDLYKNSDKDAQHGDLVKEFDKRLQSDPEFKKEVQEFVKQRGDVLSSDREVKAYMLARNEINGNTQPNTPKDVEKKGKNDISNNKKSDSPLVNAVAKALNKSTAEAESEIEGAAQHIKDLMKAKDLRNGDVEETLRGLGVEPDYAEEFMQWATAPKKKSTKKKKEPAIVREGNVNWVDPKEWNSPANDPWYALYE